MEKSVIVGVDIGGTSVKLGIFDIEGNVIEKWEIKTRKVEKGAFILHDISNSINEMIRKKGISKTSVKGVGMGVPGPVMPNGFVEICPNLGWREMNPAKILSGFLGGIPVRASNDANVAALGELWKGGASGYKTAVMFTLGTGVGGGIIMDGKVVNGIHGLSGELGHMTVNPSEEVQCNCKNHGCLEQYASATGVVRIVRRILEKNDADSCLRRAEYLSSKVVFDAAIDGDMIAGLAVDTLCMYLGMACANCAFIVDPEVFVFGGGVSKAGDFLIEGIKKYYYKFTTLTNKKAELKLATLGNDAGIYGAAKLMF